MKILNGLIIVLILYGVYFYINKTKYKKRLTSIQVDNFEDEFSLEYLQNYCKEQLNEIVKDNPLSQNLTKEEFERKKKIKANTKKALKDCSDGNLISRSYVKDLIRDILLKKGINESTIEKVVSFDNYNKLTTIDKFAIILYKYQQDYGTNAFARLVTDYNLDELRVSTADEDEECFEIVSSDIEAIFKEKEYALKFLEKLDILTQMIYQQIKGLGVIDELRYMNIDGVSGGVSGLPTSVKRDVNADKEKYPYYYENIWIFFRGKKIRLAFLNLGSENELIRIVKNIYRYGNPGQLSESNGYKATDALDGSRIVVTMPPFSETYAFLVRKLDNAQLMAIEELVTDNGSNKPIETAEWLIKGEKTGSVTGPQGVGKSTMLMALIKFINPIYALRIQEMMLELNLRKIYPTRNILSFKETDTVTGQEGLNLQKKTDGDINILGEVSDAKVASWMIQMGRVASLATYFTHHAKTADDLILSIRNNLLQTGVFTNEEVAEREVASVINFDIHLEKSKDGHRYIERITEIIPNKDVESPYIYNAVDIVRFENDKYVFVNTFSDEMKESIESKLDEKERNEFRNFISELEKELDSEI